MFDKAFTYLCFGRPVRGLKDWAGLHAGAFVAVASAFTVVTAAALGGLAGWLVLSRSVALMAVVVKW